MKRTLRWLSLVMLLSPGMLHAQDKPLACTLLGEMGLKPMLAEQHRDNAPSPFGKDGCTWGTLFATMFALTILEASPDPSFPGLEQWLARARKLNETNTKVTVTAEPTLGPEGFLLRHKGDEPNVSFFALKGTRVIILNGIWRSGPITDASMKQMREGARIALSKLP